MIIVIFVIQKISVLVSMGFITLYIIYVIAVVI
jgi:hypothetical protein